MILDDMLMLGDVRLYEVSEDLQETELPGARTWATGLFDIVQQYRKRYGSGRAVAAPQMGIRKRMVCMLIDRPVTFINPVLYDFSQEMIELWDDCMSFPGLHVRVRRHQSCTIRFRDLTWKEHTWKLEDALSELLQHEVDHLDGILATQRAIDDRAFSWVPRQNTRRK